jgi:hypothetical protein
VYSKKLPFRYVEQFQNEIDYEISRLTKINQKIDALILHYREYRYRLHGGRTPRYRTSFTPLGSFLLDNVSDLAGEKRIGLGMINYDIMNFLLPEILDIPFDSEKKEFNEERKKNCTILTGEITITPGHTYYDSEELIALPSKSVIGTPYDFLYEEFLEAVNKPFVKNFFDSKFLNDTREIAETAVAAQKFEHAVFGQGIHAVIAASIFD